MRQQVFKAGLAAWLLWVPLVVLAGFVDPLDQPALPVANPAAEPLRAITRAGGRVVVAGEHGLVAWSDDDGRTWTQADVPVSVDINALYFKDARTGWAVGHGAVILQTKDGGEHWHRQLDGRGLQALIEGWFNTTVEVNTETAQNYLHSIMEMTRPGPNQHFMGVWFGQDGTGYAVGAFGLILGSDDGGQTWWPANLKIDNDDLLHLNAIVDVDGVPWIVGELGTLWALDLEQGRFRARNVGYQGTLFGMRAEHARLVVYGLRGNLFESRDGALNWTPLPTDVRTNINTAAMMPDGAIVLAAQSGQVLVKRAGDGGFSPLPGAQSGLYADSLVTTQGDVLLVGVQGVTRLGLK